MKDQNCAYCMEGELVAAFGIKICELESSKVYLFKEQSHPGRVIVPHKKHVSEITELTAEERAAYMEDINRVACAMHEIFNPDKVNYGAYGDTGHHLHSIKYLNIRIDMNGAVYSLLILEKKHCRMKIIKKLLKNMELYYVNKVAAAPFSIVHYDFF